MNEDLEHGGYEHWPVTRADLDPHYDRVEAMMKPQRYPLEHPPYDAHREDPGVHGGGRALGLDGQLPPLAVTFANEGRPPVPGEQIEETQPNLHGPRATRAGWSASATSGATGAPRTPSTSTTSPRPSAPGPSSGPGPRCARSSPSRAAAFGSPT